MPAVRVSCQTRALWIGRPVAFSQITVVSRWLVIPMAARSPGVHLANSIEFGHHPQGSGPDLYRIVFHPARLRVDLPVFLLGLRHRLSRPVEQEAAGAGRPLIDGGDVWHLFR